MTEMLVEKRVPKPEGAPEPWTAQSGQVTGLADLSGDMQLEADGHLLGILHVANGAVSIQSDGDATVRIAADSPRTLLDILGGRLHPFVAHLQGRLKLQGDRALGLRVMLGLRSGSPWSSLTGGGAA